MAAGDCRTLRLGLNEPPQRISTTLFRAKNISNKSTLQVRISAPGAASVPNYTGANDGWMTLRPGESVANDPDHVGVIEHWVDANSEGHLAVWDMA